MDYFIMFCVGVQWHFGEKFKPESGVIVLEEISVEVELVSYVVCV